jgi:hypothetical protein
VHGVNQDFHGAMLPHEPLRSRKGIAVALADGIGSSPVSQVASAAAVRSFLEDYYATSDAWSVRRSAQRVLGATNAWLHAQTMRSHARFDKDRGYVCTFSALVSKAARCTCAACGRPQRASTGCKARRGSKSPKTTACTCRRWSRTWGGRWEYVEGHTLTQWMADHPTPELDTVRGIVEQIAKGLQAFHSKEMLHQDLRPENVLIDRNGTVRLIDYGSAHVAGLMEGTTAAKAHAMLGTLQYTAPEYFIGEEGSARSDLFSLAVITYQMLTRQLPYGLGVTQVRSAADLRKLRYNPVRHLRPELPAWLDAVLQKALQPDPSKRQEVVSELVGDLRNPDAQFMRQRGTPLIQRNPVVFWQTTTALLAAAVVVLLALLLRR